MSQCFAFSLFAVHNPDTQLNQFASRARADVWFPWIWGCYWYWLASAGLGGDCGASPRDQPARSGAARSAGPSPFSSACQGRSLRVMRPTDGFVRFKKANCLRICFLRAEQVQMLDVILWMPWHIVYVSCILMKQAITFINM